MRQEEITIRLSKHENDDFVTVSIEADTITVSRRLDRGMLFERLQVEVDNVLRRVIRELMQPTNTTKGETKR